MGQAYSHWNSEHGRQPNDNRQSAQGRAPRGNARRSGRAVRGGNSSEREDSGRAESRYSPYTTGPRAASRPTVPEPPQATQAVDNGVATTSGNIEVVQRVSLEIADPLDAERWEQADAEMHDAAAAADLGASEITDVTGTSRAGGTARARVRAGNQLLSRIVSRSIIVAIAQELERRRRAPADPPAAPAGGVSTYVMDFSSRLNLYYHVSVFILSVLEASIDAPSGGSESGGVRTGVENPVAAGLAQQQEAVTVDGASEAGDDPENGLQFRMFLLPGAIDHALAEHSSTHAPPSDTQTTPPPNMSPPPNNTVPLPNDTAPLPSGQTPEQESGENGRESLHNDREEKLRRLRDIARAMHDERRAIQIPVAVLGLRMNSELRRSTRTALQNLGERIAASEASPAPPSGLQDTIRGLRDRLTNIVPGFMAAPQQEPETEEPDIQPAAADTAAAAEQPGMSVFITIHYMQLGNPLMLPMAAYALFPELVADDTDMRSPGNYDLFMEIANILGQVRSTTVSQELVDKRLRKYHYHFDGTSPLARPTDGSSDEISLVSADRCPVCLEDFSEGDLLRVLECHHGLHLLCGDAWFTKGSNKCPICRSEAVHE